MTKTGGGTAAEMPHGNWFRSQTEFTLDELEEYARLKNVAFASMVREHIRSREQSNGKGDHIG